ncbi:hypothetical protein H8356DRAFT_936063 [Neocallimastix lanati (nom. inval.)]|uniref:Right handed beta helix domain-containing protein n=1 Tax=Neocallimastix californiae TaxID=1754190 RepID=A0A1Y2DYL7_9FUNG|nr:hypothetical protein H8356DRAFT_936063 [Neocallimastix sp. JGI-2020a]ORY63735.1 hypothetical protein LY90DRAFT_231524 [Neocallimastix californiae]|eukprot:ORY63735.1 hypothetical protein LY90DRAFT_231524 [Neocallimastix californiae]
MKLYNEINTDYIFENCDFISIEKNEISMAFEFYNSHPIFNNCTFYGNKNTSSILNYIGTNFLSNNIEIYNSYFNGNYESICFNGIDSNIIIKNSKFYNCVDNYVYHGSALHFFKSKVLVENSLFENGFSNGMGGCIAMVNSNGEFIYNTLKNCTSLLGGNGFVSFSNLNPIRNTITIKNTIQYGDINTPYSSLGAVGSFFQAVDVNIDNYIGKDLYSNVNGCLFFFFGNQNVNINDVIFENVTGKNVGGLFIHAIGETTFLNLNLNGCLLKNFYQSSERNSSSFLWINKAYSKIRNCKIYNFNGVDNTIFYQDSNSVTEIINCKFEKISSELPAALINNNNFGLNKKHESLIIKDTIFSDIKTNLLSLIITNGGSIELINSEVIILIIIIIILKLNNENKDILKVLK